MKTTLIAAAMLMLCVCVRADDNCETCKEKKCDACEKAKRCANPVKNFFVHSVGGTINSGLKQVPCKFESVYHTTASGLTPDCGCK